MSAGGVCPSGTDFPKLPSGTADKPQIVLTETRGDEAPAAVGASESLSPPMPPVYTEPLPICPGCGEPSLHHWRRDDGAYVCDNCWQDMHPANCKSEGRRIIHTYCLKCARLHLNKQVNTCPHCQSGMCITQTESDLRAQERTRAIIEFLYDDPNSEEL